MPSIKLIGFLTHDGEIAKAQRRVNHLRWKRDLILDEFYQEQQRLREVEAEFAKALGTLAKLKGITE